jgi:GT2 family glycosyltransferase
MVLNYNGRRHLDDCFSTLLVAASRSRHACRVVCVDNRSTEPDVAYLRDRFPEVEVIVAAENDFLFSLNPIVASRSEEIVVILNNDMRFDADFIDPLLTHFQDPVLFAAAAQLMNWGGESQQNAARRGRLHNAWFYKEWRNEIPGPAASLEAPGGAAAYRRQHFVELGGFDPIFRPGYYEDLDLSYRAWVRGWSTVFEPRSVIYHKEGVTLDAVFGTGRMSAIHFRNHVLFTLKNIGGWRFLIVFLVLLPVRALRPALHGDFLPVRGIVDAIGRLPAALRARRVRPRGISSSEVFDRIEHWQVARRQPADTLSGATG